MWINRMALEMLSYTYIHSHCRQVRKEIFFFTLITLASLPKQTFSFPTSHLLAFSSFCLICFIVNRTKNIISFTCTAYFCFTKQIMSKHWMRSIWLRLTKLTPIIYHKLLTVAFRIQKTVTLKQAEHFTRKPRCQSWHPSQINKNTAHLVHALTQKRRRASVQAKYGQKGNDIKVHHCLFLFAGVASSLKAFKAQRCLHQSKTAQISMSLHHVLDFSYKFMYACESNCSAVLNEISSVEFSGIPLVPRDNFDSVSLPAPRQRQKSNFSSSVRLFYISPMRVIYNRSHFRQILYIFGITQFLATCKLKKW